MKHKITLLLFVFFLTLCSFGQRKELKDDRYYEKSRVESQNKKLNRDENKNIKSPLFVKSRGFYQNLSINSSQSISSPLIIKYGLDYEISQSWDETLSQWDNSFKPVYTYDTNGNQTQYIDYYWEGSHWVSERKSEYTYDTYSNLTHEIVYYWDGSSWINDGKTEYIYNTNSNLIYYIDYFLDGSQWVAYGKTEFTYDTNGNLTQYIDYFLDGSQWVTSGKSEFTYDTNGNLTQYIDYYWDGSQWGNQWKAEYAYNTNGNQTQYIDYYWDGSQWVNEGKRKYTFGTNGNLTQYIDYYWDGSQWGNEWKADFTYNNSYSFSDLILPFFYSNTEVKMFFNHMLTNGKGYIWDETSSDWKINNNFDFSYSEKDILSISEIIERQLNIYPNPVSNILTIKSEIITIDKVEIYSLLGKKIKEINLDFNNILTEDLSKGIYLLRIYAENGTTIKKLIKK